MTEIDAPNVATIDASEIQHDLAETKGPTDVVRTLARYCVHRARGLDEGQAVPHVMGAFNLQTSAPTLSEYLVQCMATSIDAIANAVPPEDVRAYISWLCGSEQHDSKGLGVFVLEQMPDARTQHCLAGLMQTASQVLTALAAHDAKIFGDAKAILNPAEMGLITSMIEDARVAAEDRDGETSRHQAIHARKIAMKLTEINLKTRQAFPPDPLRARSVLD